MYTGGSKNWQSQRHGRVWRKPMAQQAHLPSTPATPLGKLLRELKVDELNDSAKQLLHTASITDCAVVASFNWVGKRDPTIVVPGRPARWTPLSKAEELPDDNGNKGNPHWSSVSSTRQCWRDGNAAYYPKHPMEPTVLAVLKMAPKIQDEKKVDVVACGSTLGNLLRFVSGQDKPFRMLVEVVDDDTVFFIRRENSPTETITGLQGYGHSFPEHYTTWDADVKGSKSHQRLVHYTFGGLRFLVRSEADGYIGEQKSSDAADKSKVSGHAAETQGSSSLAEVIDALSATKITSDRPTSDAELQIEMSGELVDQDRVFDLKTRSVKKRDQEDTVGGELPRLWVRQLRKFVLAYHERGVFNDIRVMDVADEVKEWEGTNRDLLAKFAAIIHRIVDMVRARPSGKLEICQTETGRLEIREQLADAGHVLSQSARAMWTSRGRAQWSGDEDDGKDQEEGTKEVLKPTAAVDWVDGDANDFTACSETCGYCGQCTY